jgi:RNA polymerase sigma-70 factor, ECF subfamily
MKWPPEIPLNSPGKWDVIGSAPLDDGRGSRLDSMSDEQLVALIQQGNASAFNRLAERWEASLYRFTLRTLGNPEDARDVCQESLLKAYQQIGRLREGGKFKAWVHHIALNLCRDRFRSPAARAETRSIDDEEYQEGALARELAAFSPPQTRPERGVLMRTIEEVMGSLPAEQRTAILLREYQGFTSEEIGEITGVPAATIRTRIFYGLRSMRRMLQERGIS